MLRMENLAIAWNDVGRHLARIAGAPMSPEVMIGLRVLLIITLCIATAAQLRAWRGEMNGWRHITGIGSSVIVFSLAMSAILTAHGGNNIKTYQAVLLLGLLLRVVADAQNAGRRRREKRIQEGRPRRDDLDPPPPDVDP